MSNKEVYGCWYGLICLFVSNGFLSFFVTLFLFVRLFGENSDTSESCETRIYK